MNFISGRLRIFGFFSLSRSKTLLLGGFLSLFFFSSAFAVPQLTTSTINNGADRIFITSTASQTVVLAIANDGDAVVEQIVIDPPANVTITDWTVNITTAGTAGLEGTWSDGTATGVADEASQAVALAEGVALTLTGDDGVTETGILGHTTGAMTLTIEFDTGATVGVSGDWTVSGNSQDDGGGTAATAAPATYKIAVVGEDDLAFDIVVNGGTVGTVADLATGSVYIYDPDGTNFDIADWTTVKKTLSNGLAVYENTVDFTGTADGTFDYAVTGTNEGTVVSDQAYDFTGGTNHFAAARGADIAAPIISAVVINTASNKNIFTITYDQPVLVDTLLAVADPIATGIASTATLGDMTTAKTLAGIAAFDGSADMTSLTTHNTVRIDDTFTILTIVSNGQNGGYYNAGTTGPSTDEYTEDASAEIVNPSQDQATAAAGPSATVTAAWDVTKPTIDTVITQDADTDGNVDRAEITFSENIDDSTTAAAHYEIGDIAVTGYSTTNCATGDADADDEKACFTLSDGTEVTGTALATVDLITAGLADLAGNRAVVADDVGTSSKTDGASPVLMTIYSYDVDTTTDTALDGDADEIWLTFSESISDATVADDEIAALLDDALTVDNNDYSLDTWITAMSFRTNSGTDQVEHASTDADNDQYLTFEPTVASVLDGTASLVVSIEASFADATGNVVIPGYYKKKVGAHTLISDADGDFSAGSSDLGANYGYRDMALPQLLTAATGDQDENGLIDHYTLTFSEIIDESTLTDANANGWAVADFGAASGGTAEILHEASALNDSAFDDTDQAVFYLAFAEDAAAAYTTGGTGIKPALSYVDDNINGVTDYTALELASIADATETDAAAPIYSLVGTSVNAAGDTIALTFTEVMDPTTITTAIVRANTNVLLDYSNDAGNASEANITVTNATAVWSGGDTVATITLNETTDFAYIPSAKFVGVTLASVTDLVANAEAGAERYTAAGVTAETTVPTVTNLGTGLRDYYILATATSDIVFGEVLSTTAKTAVETALDAGANNNPQSYAWAGVTLTITAHATLDTLFRNDVTADITDLVGNTSSGVTIVDSFLDGDGGSTSCNKPSVINFPEEVDAPLEKLYFSVAPTKTSSLWKNAESVKDRITITINDTLVSPSNIEVIAPNGDYTSQVIVSILPSITESGRIPIVVSIKGEPDKESCNLNGNFTLNVKGASTPTSSSSSSGGSGGGGGGSSSSSSSSSARSVTAPRTTTPSPVVTTPSSNNTVITSRNLSKMKTFKGSATGKEFKDVSDGDWEKPYIAKVSSAGIMTGYADPQNLGKFGKNDLITNAQILKVGLESFGDKIPSSVSSEPYGDVPTEAWFASYAQKAKELNIVPQIVGNRLNPNEAITRGKALKYLVEMAGVDLSNIKETDNYFGDLSFNRSFAPHIIWATKNGIVNGYAPDGSGKREFGPYDPLTRGQLAKVVVNLLEFLAKQ